MRKEILAYVAGCVSLMLFNNLLANGRNAKKLVVDINHGIRFDH